MYIDARCGGFAIPLLAVAKSIFNKEQVKSRAKTKANEGAFTARWGVYENGLVAKCWDMKATKAMARLTRGYQRGGGGPELLKTKNRMSAAHNELWKFFWKCHLLQGEKSQVKCLIPISQRAAKAVRAKTLRVLVVFCGAAPPVKGSRAWPKWYDWGLSFTWT